MQPGNDWVAVIIEDDPDVRDLIDIVLTQSGFRTVVTENGPEGVEAVRTHNPLITTLDVNMPGMDGFAVARRLREFSNTYLIMITALADEIDVVQGFEAGADDYLVKPFRPRELRARADSMLRRPRTRFEAPAGWAEGEEPAPAAPQEESWAAAAARDLAANTPLQPLHEQPAPPPQPAYPHPVPPAPQPHQQPPPQPAPPAQQPPPQPPPQPAPAAPQPHQPSPPQQQSAPAYQQQVYPQQPAPQAAPPAPVPPADPGAHGAPPNQGGWIRFNGLALNNETRVVTVNGATVDLTRTEFDLIASLLSTGRRVRSKADLVLTMRGQQYVTSYFVNEADKRSVEVHIANLRRKIGDDSGSPRYIETVRGVGYRLAEAV
jgi:two-component system, OmpR family, response regulator